MDFTVVTPSLRQLEDLECCIASVADQGLWEDEEARKGAGAGKAEAITVEHIVQDAGSPGIEKFAEKMGQMLCDQYGGKHVLKLAGQPLLDVSTTHGFSLRIYRAADTGMYQALNRGFRKASGEFLAYLNCDEQYLPGTLLKISRRFRACAKTDLVLGDVLVVDEAKKPVCLRRMISPGLAHTWTCHFTGLTAGIFFRRRLLEQGFSFDETYRIAGDAEWFVRVLRAKKKVQTMASLCSAFTVKPGNLGLSEAATRERERLNRTAPRWMRLLDWHWVFWHRLRRWISGSHRKCNIAAELYFTGNAPRKKIAARKLRTTWPGRLWQK